MLSEKLAIFTRYISTYVHERGERGRALRISTITLIGLNN